MKTIQKSILKENYYWESEPWYEKVSDTIVVPKYKTEIFPKDMYHKEILEKYKIEPYKNIDEAFAVAADCIKDLKNDYKGRIIYFYEGKILCRLRVWRDGGDGKLSVGVAEVNLDGECSTSHGACFSSIPLESDIKTLESSDTLELQNWEKEFDKKFIAHITSEPGNVEHDRAVIFFEDTVKIKDFIQNLLTSHSHKIKEDLRGKIMKMTKYQDCSCYAMCGCPYKYQEYNSAILDVLSLLLSKE